MKLNRKLSERIFAIATLDDLNSWIRDVEKALGGVTWLALGGFDNNIHPFEVWSDPAAALVELPTNSIDAELDLKARELGQTAPTPNAAAKKWWGVPAQGLSAMDEKARRQLADMIQVIMVESGDPQRPTIIIQDQGTGQHPDDFPRTHLSLMQSNKKRKTHQMGVYNAGGAGSCKFAAAKIIVSRLAPSLLDGRHDEIGISVIRYNALDPDLYRSGVYEYMAAKDRTIIRMDLDEIPEIGHGTYVKLIEYEVPKYARAANEPKHSLWHLFHAALPDPALPFRIIEQRLKRFDLKSMERRVVTGLLHLLTRTGTADYSDERTISLGDPGKVTLRYFVLNADKDPDAYTTSEQGLTITLNGQRQITKDRAWVRRNLGLYYLTRRLVIFVDGTELTNAAKRQVFSSTRETGVDSPLMKTIVDQVVREIEQDEDLYNLEELAKQKTLEDATKSTTEKVKRQLASQIAALLKGAMAGIKGGRRRKKHRRGGKRPPGGKPPITDDSLLPDVPTKLSILTKPLRIHQGDTAPLRLEINAKNGFLPKYASNLSVVLGSELSAHVKVVSTGRLLGGHVRVILEASSDAPVAAAQLKVALVIPELGVLLTDTAPVEVVATRESEQEPGKTGGEPNVEISWVGREKWDAMEPQWDEETVGECHIHREDPADKDAITKVDWIFNKAFGPYETVVAEKRLGEEAMKNFRERYEIAVALGLFRQRRFEQAREEKADEEGQQITIPDDYVKSEKARLARAVLMVMEPEVSLAEVAAAAS